MSATRNTAADGPGEASLTRELDILLAPLSKQLRYPLPVPQHLADAGAGVLDYTSTSPVFAGAAAAAGPGYGFKHAVFSSSSPSSPSSSPAEVSATQARRDDMTRALERQAWAYCASRVEELQVWQDRVEEGLCRGRDSQRVLEHVLDGVSSMRDITRSVQDQSNSLSHNASVLIARKVRLVQVQEELQRTIQHFTHMEDLCRESEDSMMTAASPRFPQLFQDLESEMQFLSRHAQFKSAKVYAMKLAVAQQKTATKLMNAIKASFAVALRETKEVSKQQHLGRTPSLSSSSVVAVAAITDGGGDASQHPHSSPAASNPPSRSGSLMLAGSPSGAPPPGVGLLDLANPTESFVVTLRLLNEAFLDRCARRSSLRRMAELRSSFSYTGAEAFGEEPVNSVEEDPILVDILRYYCETRVGLVGPLLKNWLTMWCKMDTLQQAQQTGAATPQLRAIEAAGGSDGQAPPPRSAPGSPASDAKEAAGGGGTPLSPGAATAAVANNNNNMNSSLESSPVAATSFAGNASRSFTGSQHGSSSPLTGLAAAVGSQTQLPHLAEHICSLLEVSLQEEKSVLDAVWLRGDFASYVFPKLVSDIAEELYHAFRARLVRVDDLEELAATVEHIQVVNLRQVSDDSVVQELSRLWVRMIQDVQERMIFRTSVCLRQDVGRGHPTRQLVQRYTDIITAGVAPTEDLPLVQGVQNAVHLLMLLYPTLEFSVFSVFAEEAVKSSLQLVKELGKMMSSQTALAPWTEVMSLGTQLMHLLYVRNELARIDANITVVEKSLDFAKLAKNRTLEIVQSSRESKKVVESEVQTCSTKLSQCLCEVVARPMTGATRMSASAVGEKLREMEDLAAKGKYLVFLLIRPQHPATQEALAFAVDRRVEGLTHEVAEMVHLSAPASNGNAPPPPAPTPPTV